MLPTSGMSQACFGVFLDPYRLLTSVDHAADGGCPSITARRTQPTRYDQPSGSNRASPVASA